MFALNEKVERLMLAIMKKESWMPVSKEAQQSGTMSYRHHNPGNLRYSIFECDNVEGFSVFKNDFIGAMALQYDLLQKAKGNTVTDLNGTSTLRDLIFTYAPPDDNNNSEKYLEDVVKSSGIKETETLGEIFEL